MENLISSARTKAFWQGRIFAVRRPKGRADVFSETVLFRVFRKFQKYVFRARVLTVRTLRQVLRGLFEPHRGQTRSAGLAAEARCFCDKANCP